MEGARVLVVDDEFLIAAQLEADLTAAGAEVVGPSQTLQEASDFAARERLTRTITIAMAAITTNKPSKGTRSFHRSTSRVISG